MGGGGLWGDWVGVVHHSCRRIERKKESRAAASPNDNTHSPLLLLLPPLKHALPTSSRSRPMKSCSINRRKLPSSAGVPPAVSAAFSPSATTAAAGGKNARALSRSEASGAPSCSAPCWMKALQALFSASSSWRFESTYALMILVCVCVFVCVCVMVLVFFLGGGMSSLVAWLVGSLVPSHPQPASDSLDFICNQNKKKSNTHENTQTTTTQLHRRAAPPPR